MTEEYGTTMEMFSISGLVKTDCHWELLCFISTCLFKRALGAVVQLEHVSV